MVMTLGVVVAHPDDEVLTCGGTIAKAVEAGEAVHCFIFIPRHLRGDLELAQKVLGYTSWDAPEQDYPDNQLDTVPLLSLAQDVERWLARVRPDRLITQHPCCLNVDHRLVAQAVVTATRPGTSSVDAVYAGETPSATEWAWAEAPWRPTRYEVLTTHQVDLKVQAMELYKSERRPSPHPRSPDGLYTLAKMRGRQASTEWAEAFTVLREVVR